MRIPIGALLGCTLVSLTLAVPDWSSQQPLGHVDNESSQDALPFSTSDLVEYIEDAMKKWHAPGMAVAIINGNVTWAEVSIFLSFPMHTLQGVAYYNNPQSNLPQPRASATPPSHQNQ